MCGRNSCGKAREATGKFSPRERLATEATSSTTERSPFAAARRNREGFDTDWSPTRAPFRIRLERGGWSAAGPYEDAAGEDRSRRVPAWISRRSASPAASSSADL